MVRGQKINHRPTAHMKIYAEDNLLEKIILEGEKSQLLGLEGVPRFHFLKCQKNEKMPVTTFLGHPEWHLWIIFQKPTIFHLECWKKKKNKSAHDCVWQMTPQINVTQSCPRCDCLNIPAFKTRHSCVCCLIFLLQRFSHIPNSEDAWATWCVNWDLWMTN